MKVSVIIAAAGVGDRFGGSVPKQFVELEGRPVLAWSLEVFSSSSMVHEIVVVGPPSDEKMVIDLVERFYTGGPPIKVVPGGATRQESVRQGLNVVFDDAKWIAVHDGARPLLTQSLFESVCHMAREIGAAIPALPIRDTVKEIYEEGLVLRTLDRSRLYLAQTPQVCKKQDLLKAYEEAAAKGLKATDEAGLLEAIGVPVGVVEGSSRNLKITTQDDLQLVRALLSLKPGLCTSNA